MSDVRISINAIAAGHALAQAVLAGSESAKALAEALKADVERLSCEGGTFDKKIQEARDQYCADDLEIDDHPILSVSDEGIWINAWVWLPR